MKPLQDYKIKSLSEQDIVKIEIMENEIFFLPWSNNLLKQIFDNKNNILLGAFSEDNLVGYLIASTIFDESELLRLAVLPEFRGCGLAKKMLSYYSTSTQQCQKFYLEVEEDNEPAKTLYLSFGYVVYHIRKNYYSNGTSALLMKRETND